MLQRIRRPRHTSIYHTHDTPLAFGVAKKACQVEEGCVGSQTSSNRQAIVLHRLFRALGKTLVAFSRSAWRMQRSCGRAVTIRAILVVLLSPVDCRARSEKVIRSSQSAANEGRVCREASLIPSRRSYSSMRTCEIPSSARVGLEGRSRLPNVFSDSA